MKLNRIESSINRENRTKLNENMSIIENDFSIVNNDLQEFKEIVDENYRLSNRATLEANKALVLSNSVQRELDNIVVEGDSSVESAQARTNSNTGETYISLRARLDEENKTVTQQLEQSIFEIENLEITKAPIEEVERLEDVKATKVELTSSINDVNAILDLKASYADIAGLVGTPIFVDSVAEMVDITRIYVNRTDDYIYQYNGTSFVTTGKKYAETGLSADSVDAAKLTQVLQETLFIGYDWELGTISTGGTNSPNNTRIRSKMSKLLKLGTEIKISDSANYKYALHYWDPSDGSYIGQTGWRTDATTTLDVDYLVKAIVARADDSDLTNIIDTVSQKLLIVGPDSLLRPIDTERLEKKSVKTEILDDGSVTTEKMEDYVPYTLSTYIVPELRWELGSLTNTGGNNNVNTRIRTANYVYLHENSVCDLTKLENYNNYQMGYHVYDKNKVPMFHVPFLNERKFTVAQDAYYRFFVRKTDNSVIPDQEIHLIGDKISITDANSIFVSDFVKPNSVGIDKLDKKLSSVINKHLEIICNWELGGITSTGGDGNNTIRVRTLYYYFENDTVVDITGLGSEYQLTYSMYDDSKNHLYNSGFLSVQKVILKKDYYYRIAIRNVNNIDLTDKVEFVSDNVSIYSTDSVLNRTSDISGITQNTVDATVKAVAHRGWSDRAPECTLPAYTLAKKMGISFGEVDILWTADNYPVCLHLDDISHTSNGTGLASEKTLAELKTYDFGSWKSPEYTGTRIPTFEEFLLHCKKINMRPYVHIKTTNNLVQLATLPVIARRLGMLDKCTWLCQSGAAANAILDVDETARIGYLVMNPITAQTVSAANTLKRGKNEVFLSVPYENVTKEISDMVLDGGIKLEVWIVNDEPTVKTMASYGVSGITTDMLNILDVLNEDIE